MDQLGGTVNEAVAEQVDADEEHVLQNLYDRALNVWNDVVAAEEAFWPELR